MKTKNKTQHPRLGIDIGRVIMAPVKGGKSDSSFLSGDIEQALETPPSPGAIESIARLVEAFKGRVWLVSKAGPNTQRKTWFWLEHHKFYQRTSILSSHVRFCFKRPEKAIHCKEMKINYFIDDRLDVLEHIKYCVENRYLFGEQPRDLVIPSGIKPVINWAITLNRILKDIST